jgi:sugar/nucleoside kinase (ribokinase family)
MYEKRNEYDFTIETLNSVKSKLDDRFAAKLKSKRVFLAIDGFIDSLYSLIKSRKSLEDYKKFSTIKEFADRLHTIAGSSGNIELYLKKKTSGGFVPNNGKALSSLGVNLFLLGALGYPKIKKVFSPLINKSNVDISSIANPGKTIGLEFSDGKIMLSDFKGLYEISWDTIKSRIKTDILIEELEHSDAIGFGYWSLTSSMTKIWKKFSKEVFPSLSNLNKKFFFIDLADVKKRSTFDILEMLDVVKRLEDKIPILMSLNDQEAIDISKALDEIPSIDPKKENFKDFISAGKNINNELNLSYLVIHSPHFATISLKNDEGHYWITEGYTAHPSFTVSAGDHFLSGVVVGLLGGLTPQEAILVGNALTAIFVRIGRSPKFNELTEFISKYIHYIDQDDPKFP